MAIIYGRPDSEKQLLDLYPKPVKTFEYIENAPSVPILVRQRSPVNQ